MAEKIKKHRFLRNFKQEFFMSSLETELNNSDCEMGRNSVDSEENTSDPVIQFENIFFQNLSPAKILNLMPRPTTYQERLKMLCVKHIRRTSNLFITDLLNFLREEDGHTELPKTAVTFLGTAKCGVDYFVRPMNAFKGREGRYCYLGIAAQLPRYIIPEIYPSKKIEIFANVDGISLYQDNQRNEQMWPISVKIFTKKCKAKVFLVAIYYGKSKPASAQEFMNDFIEEINELTETGIEIQDKHYKFKFRGFICDIPARVFLKATKSATGFFSCERCTIEGKTFKPKDARKRKLNADGDDQPKPKSRKEQKRIFSQTNCSLRTHEDFVNRTQVEHHKKNELSCLLEIENFDIINDVFIDPMHMFDSNNTKRIIAAWKQTKKKAKGKISEDNLQKLSNITNKYVKRCIPLEFHRNDVDIQNSNGWKANQSRLFMLYVAPVIMKKFFPEEQYSHLLKYVVGYRILSDPDLIKLPENVDFADDALKTFFTESKKFYGDDIQVLTMHYLCHVATDVKNKKLPLHVLAANNFENCLGIIKHLIRAPNHPLTQAINRYSEICKQDPIMKEETFSDFQ